MENNVEKIFQKVQQKYKGLENREEKKRNQRRSLVGIRTKGIPARERMEKRGERDGENHHKKKIKTEDVLF